MIQQRGSRSANPIRDRFQQLCHHGRAQTRKIEQFVKDLYSVEGVEQQSSLSILAMCIIDGLARQQSAGIAQDTIAQLIAIMIKQMVRFQYQKGTLQIAQIISNTQVQNLLQQSMAQNNSQNRQMYFLKQQLDSMLNREQFKKVTKLLSTQSIQQNTPIKTIQILKYLINLLKLSLFSHKQNNLNPQTLISIVDQSLKTFVSGKEKFMNKTELQLFVNSCFQYQQIYFYITHEIKHLGYEAMINSIISVLKLDNLDKKFNALSTLDDVLTKLQNMNKDTLSNQIKLNFAYQPLLNVILDPRNHEEVLNRSSNFIKYWIQNIQGPDDLKPLHQWLTVLVLKSDNRTSKIFGESWRKLIQHVRVIGRMEVEKIYDISFDILKTFNVGKKHNTRSRKLNQQNRKQEEVKAMRVFEPLFKKQFLPFQNHEKLTFEFLSQVWKIRQVVSETFQNSLNEQLMVTVQQLISPKFNLYILQVNIQKLCHLVKTLSLSQNDANAITAEYDITLIYKFIRNFMDALSLYVSGKVKNNIQSEETFYDKEVAQIGNIGTALLTEKQILNYLIICHNSNSKQQLITFLQLMELLISCMNDFQFEKSQLGIIMRKVNISDEYFLAWIKKKIAKIQNNQFRKSIISQMFRNPDVYTQITLIGIKNLLQILAISDLGKLNKQSFCLSLLEKLDPNIQKEAINMILPSLWSVHQIETKTWLQRIAEQIQQMKFSTALQILIYTQAIKLSQSHNLYLGEDVYSQNIAVKQQIDIQIILHLQEPIVKKVKCWDDISLGKFKKLHVQTLHNLQIFKQISVEVIKLQEAQVISSEYYQSLRKLGFKNDKVNEVNIFYRRKDYLILRQLKDGVLEEILNNMYGFELTKDASEICIRKQLKNLYQVLQRQSQKHRFNLHQITKQNFTSIMKTIIQNILNQRYDRRFKNKLNSELVQFLISFDQQDQLWQKKIENQLWSHRKFMSQQNYFIQKALQLLQKPIKIQKSTTKSRILKNGTQKNQDQQIGYQFISLLVIGEAIQKFMFKGLNRSLTLNPSQYPFIIAFELEVLWMVLKQKTVMSMFLESGSFNQIFGMANKCIETLMDDEIIISGEVQQIILKIIGTAIKIFNSIIIIGLVKNNFVQLSLISQHPNDLLDIHETKNKINLLSSVQNVNKLKNQNYLIRYSLSVLEICRKDFYIQIQPKDMMQIFVKMSKLLLLLHGTPKEADAFFNFYQVAKLNCWTIVLSQQIQKTLMIKFLATNLNTAFYKINSISKSLLYIYLRMDTQINCKKIIEALKQNFMTNNLNANSKIYFQIFSECFEFCSDSNLIESVIQYFTFLLIDAKPEEQGEKPNESLEGILSVIKQNISKFNTNATQTFLILMFSNYLFLSCQPVKAIHPKTRKIIYESIQACLEHHKQIDTQNLFQKVKQEINIAINIQGEIKQIGLGVGLQNLGNICYMNSLLQMLHSISPFVNQVCNIKTQFPLLLGLQKLFLHLTNSLKKHISPQQFINNFDPPINVSLQEDTTQFLASFLDKLQSGEKSKTFQHLIRKYFKGQTVSKMLCSECKKGKQIVESFILYPISLNNEGTQFKDLEEGFHNNKIPQIIYDVNCDHCKKKSKFTKQTSLKKIPKYFFIHLKRLIYDYRNPYTKVKVHQRFVFPRILQVNEEKLKLKSVITHSGTGEYGHYFTSVRQKNDKWIIYNDSRVLQMPENGPQQIWYGQEGMHQSGHSTNAYVLLYENIDEQQRLNSQIKIQSGSLSQISKQIQEANRKLMIKKFILGDEYRQDFVDFAFNLLRMYKTPKKLTQIYVLLSSLSYGFGITPSISPTTYFQSFQSKQDVEKVAEAVYKYREENNTFLFHKNSQIRVFFQHFLMKILDTAPTNISYACWSLKKCSSLLKQPQTFINSGEFIKLLGFFIRKLNRNSQLMKQFYENKTIQGIIQLYKSRKIQIKANYEAATIELMQPFLQLLVSFLMIARNGSQQIEWFNEYQRDVQIIRNSIKNENELMQLLFLCNSNQDYTGMLLELLELNGDEEFMSAIVSSVCEVIGDIDRMDTKTVKNICFMIYFASRNYYNRSDGLKQAFTQAVMGIVYPYDRSPHSYDHSQYMPDHDNRVSTLKDRTYFYETNKCTPGLMQMLCRLLLDVTYYYPMIPADKVESVKYLLTLLLQLLKDNHACVRYINDLPSPIALYADYVQFQWHCIDDLYRKVDIGTAISGKLKPNTGRDLRQLVQLIKQLMGQQNSMQAQQDEAIICGSLACEPITISDYVIAIPDDRICVTVYEYQYHWCGYRDSHLLDLLQFVDAGHRLKNAYLGDDSLTKIIKPLDDNTIQEQQTSLNKLRNMRVSNSMEIDREMHPQIHQGKVRRLIQFRNVDESSYQFILCVQCNNMKNRVIETHMRVGPLKYARLWVEKRRMNQQWGEMKVVVNGQELKIQCTNMMDMR